MAGKEVRAMRRAYSYVRFSSKHQAGGDSLRRQLAATRAYCVQEGLVLDEELCYQDLGMSAFKGRNGDVGALAAFRQAVQSGRVPPGSVLVVESLDRLSREQLDEALRLFLELLGHGVNITTLLPRREYTKASTEDITGLLEPLIVMQRAHEESATKASRVRDAWSQKRRSMPKPATKVCPAWLRLKADRSAYEVIPEKAKAVRRIYQLAREGYGTIPIALRLSQEGIPPISGRKSYWSRAYVQRILESRAVIGEHQPHVMRDGKRVPEGEVIKDYYPPLMSKEEWYAVRGLMRSRCTERGPRAEGLRYLFTGLLRDARAGCTMYLKQQGHARVTHYLVPSSVVDGREPWSRPSFPYQPFEDAFLFMLNHKLAAALAQQGPENYQQPIQAVIDRQMERQRRVESIKRRLQKHPDYENLLDALEREEEGKRADAQELENLRQQQSNRHAETLAEGRHILTLLRDCPREELTDLRTRLRARIRQLVAEIWVLIEGEVRQEKWATVQVFFHNGGWLRYTFAQTAPTMPGVMVHLRGGSLDVDLRQWRHLPEAERPSFPCPRVAITMTAARELIAKIRRGEL
jgi:DNA invertase Pin-like site-specific DNA recombinase